MPAQPLRIRSRKASASQPVSLRVNFLAASAKSLAATSPALAAHLNTQAATVAQREGLHLNKAMASSVCRNCGGALGAGPSDSAEIVKLSHQYQRRKRAVDDTQSAASKRSKLNAVALLRTCEVCGEKDARPFFTGEAAAQAAGAVQLHDATHSKASGGRVSASAPSDHTPARDTPAVNQRSALVAGAAAPAAAANGAHSGCAAVPSTLALVGNVAQAHAAHSAGGGGGGNNSKTTSAVEGGGVLARAVMPANSQQAAAPAGGSGAVAGGGAGGGLEASLSMASQYAQQARLMQAPDLSTADNYNSAAMPRPQLSDSVVQPDLSLVQQAAGAGGCFAAGAEFSGVSQAPAGCVAGPDGSRAGSRGGSGPAATTAVGRTESVCSKYPRPPAAQALSERVGEAPGTGGGLSRGGSATATRSARRSTQRGGSGGGNAAAGGADGTADDASIGTFASVLSGQHRAGPARGDEGAGGDGEEHVTSPVRHSKLGGVSATNATLLRYNGDGAAPPSTAATHARPGAVSEVGPLAPASLPRKRHQQESTGAGGSGGMAKVGEASAMSNGKEATETEGGGSGGGEGETGVTTRRATRGGVGGKGRGRKGGRG